MRRLAGFGAVLMALFAGGVSAQTIEFVEPSTTTVRGDVRVQVDLGDAYKNGSVAFYLGAAGEILAFNSATIADAEGLFTLRWSTQGGQTKVPDGEYRVLAIGYNAAGEVIGQKSITLQVQNDVPASQLPATGILLRYNLTPGRNAGYSGASMIAVDGGEGLGDDAFKSLKVQGFGGAVVGAWGQRILWRNPDGKAQVRNSIYAHAEARPLLGGREMPASGRLFSFLQTPEGQMIRREDLTPVEFPLAELSIEFPDKPVKVGDQWRSKMTVLVDPRSNYLDELIGTHTLTSVEWFGGTRCAVIKSEFTGGPYRLTLAGVKQEEQSAGGGGMSLGPSSAGPPAGPGGPGGSGGGGAPAEPVEQKYGVTILLKGERTTYFAFQPEVGRVLKIEETMDQRCALEGSGSSAAASGGMGGPAMMIPGGLVGGSGDAGAAPPAIMGGGMPGMMPSLPPGGPGPGLPGMSGMPGMPGPAMAGSGAAAGAGGLGPPPGFGSGMPGMPGPPGMPGMPGMPGPAMAGSGAGLGMAGMEAGVGGSGGAQQQQKNEVKVGHFQRRIKTDIEIEATRRRALDSPFYL